MNEPITVDALLEPWSGVYRKAVAMPRLQLVDAEGKIVEDDTRLVPCTITFTAPDGYKFVPAPKALENKASTPH